MYGPLGEVGGGGGDSDGAVWVKTKEVQFTGVSMAAVVAVVMVEVVARDSWRLSCISVDREE
jgi:hypothetical protein